MTMLGTHLNWHYSQICCVQVKVTNSKTFQNQIFPEFRYRRKKPFNTKKYTHMIITKSRNCAKLELRKSGIGQFCVKWFFNWLRKLLFFRAKLMRNERKNLRFVPQKLRKSFANGNPSLKTKMPSAEHQREPYLIFFSKPFFPLFYQKPFKKSDILLRVW